MFRIGDAVSSRNVHAAVYDAVEVGQGPLASAFFLTLHDCKVYGCCMGDSLKIGEVADRVGVSAAAVRYYERIGVLPSASCSVCCHEFVGVDGASA